MNASEQWYTPKLSVRPCTGWFLVVDDGMGEHEVWYATEAEARAQMEQMIEQRRGVGV